MLEYNNITHNDSILSTSILINKFILNILFRLFFSKFNKFFPKFYEFFSRNTTLFLKFNEFILNILFWLYSWNLMSLFSHFFFFFSQNFMSFFLKHSDFLFSKFNEFNLAI